MPFGPLGTWIAPLADTGFVNAFASDGAGGVYVADVGIVRVSTIGRTMWKTSTTDLWSTAPVATYVSGIAADANGNAVVAGQGLSLLSSGDGHALWTVKFQGDVEPANVVVLLDGTIAHVGTFVNTVTFGDATLRHDGTTPYLARFRADGSVLGAQLWTDFTSDLASNPRAEMDADGNLVLVSNSALTVVSPALRVVKTVAWENAGSVALAQDGSLYAVPFDPSGALSLNRFRSYDAATPSWTFRVPPAFGKPGGALGVDGVDGALVWSGALWSVDTMGNATALVRDGALDPAIASALGQPGMVVSAGSQRPVIVDAERSIFLCGAMGTSASGGGWMRAFVMKISRP